MYFILYVLLIFIVKLLYLCLFEDFFFIIINIGSNLIVKLSMLCIEDRFYLC